MFKDLLNKLPSGKKTGTTKPKKNKKKKGKKQAIDDSLIVSKLQLDEETLDSAIEKLSDLLEEIEETPNRNGALVELPNGYVTAIALDNEALSAIYDESDENFGMFINDISEDLIANLRLGADLEQGLLVILPTVDALQSMSEQSVLSDVTFQWVVYPSEMDDGVSATLCNQTVTLDELQTIASKQAALSYTPEDGLTITEPLSGASDATADDLFESDDDFEDAGFDDESYDVNEDADDAFLSDDNYEDVALEDSYDETTDSFDSYDEYADYEDAYGEDAFSDTDTFANEDSFGETEMFDDDSTIDVATEDSDNVASKLNEITDEQMLISLDALEEYKYHNDEFGIRVNDDVFNRHFAIKNFELPLFDTKVDDPNNALEVMMAQQRKDMNREIIRIHANNLVNLRNEWTSNLAKAYDHLVARFNIDDESTKYGQALKLLRDKYNEDMDAIHTFTQKRIDELESDYETERKRVGEKAYREATERYDLDNKVNLEVDKRRVRDEIATLHRKELAIGERELKDRRLMEMRREFDKAETNIIIQLQAFYKNLIKREFANIDHFRLQLEKTTRDHYADEVARAKALQKNEDYKQSIEQLKVRFNEMTSAKDAELREQLSKYERMDAEWNKRHNELIAKLKQEHDEEVSLLQRKNDRLQQNLVDIGGQQDAESQKRIRTLENLIATQNVQLEQLQNAKQKSSILPIIASVGIVIALILGLGSGFMFSHLNQQKQEVPTAQAQQPTVYAPQNYYGANQGNTDKSSDSSESESKETGKTTETKETSTSTSTTQSSVEKTPASASTEQSK